MSKVFDIISELIGKSQDNSHAKTELRKRKRTSVKRSEKLFLNTNALANLEKILSHKKLVETGQVKLLGLDNLKKKLGDKWPTLLDGIHESLVNITQSIISDKDVFFSISDDEFIIVFATASDKVAKLICAKILQRLNEKFIGHVDTKDIIVRTAVQQINGDILFKPEDLKSLLGQVDIDVKNQETQNSDDVSADKVHIEADKNVQMQDSYTLGYCPVWDAKNEVITTYLINAYETEENNLLAKSKQEKIGYDVLVNQNTKEFMIELDQVILSSSIYSLDDLYQNNFRIIFNIPLCYETVFNTGLLMQYASRCKLIPDTYKKYIVFSLVNFPDGIPFAKLRFIVSTLKKYSSAVLMHTATVDLDLEKCKDTGIKVIGTHITAHGDDRIKAWEKLTLFIQNCHKIKMRVELLDVDTLEDLVLAKTTGVDYISGQAIGEYKDTCGHMQRLPWKMLVSRQ